MEDLIIGLTALFNFFWVQLANFTLFFVNNIIGQIIIFSLVLSLIIWVISALINMGKGD